MAALAERLLALQAAIHGACQSSGRSADAVRLIAVSKLQPLSAIREAVASGQVDFGENYAQELRDKDRELAALPERSPLRWHFIGPLQRNKVHLVVGRASLVHSVDSGELAVALGERAAKHRAGAEFVQDCLVQVNLAGEQQKAGCPPEALPALLETISATQTLRCRGLMCLPPAAADPEDSRPYFRRLRELRDAASNSPRPRIELVELSMGMSADYAVAIAEGATLIRVGTALFGERPQ